jgi:uncharacterized protein YndB with AHSA1/START domain
MLHQKLFFKAITDPNELTNWFPDQAILEPKIGGKIKFSFYENSKRGNPCGRDNDNFREGTIREFISNKKISYTWEDLYDPDFPSVQDLRPSSTMKVGLIS